MEDCLICLQSGMLETNRSWDDLPKDLLSLILSRLFFRDRSNFKLVCKSWNLICPAPPQLSPVGDSQEFDSPCLMISQSSNCSWKMFYSLCNDFYYLNFPELMGTEILYSKDGWLLMSKHEHMLFFFNPFTKEKIELPPTNTSFYSICFTSPPTSSYCIVFGILDTDTLSDIDFCFIKVGNEEWESRTANLGTKIFWKLICPPVFLNGVYYCLDCRYKNIMMFDLTKEKYELIEIENFLEEKYEDDEDDEEEDDNKYEDKEKVDIIPKIARESYMVEVEGDILGVFVARDDRRVSIQKLNLFEKRWIKFKSLGDKCLYNSINGSFAETCVVDGTANKIYFNKFHGKSGVMYSLTSRMYHSVDGGFASKKAYGLIEVDYGVWIKHALDQK